MRSRLLLLNLLLMALIAGAVWQLRQNWLAGREREMVLLQKRVPPLPVPQILVPPAPKASNAVDYLEVAARLLMSRDRNPNVIVVVPPEPVQPPLPRFYGVMDWGDGPSLYMAERPGAAQKRYRLGETIGEFKIVKLEESGITFEWNKKEVKAGFGEMKDQPGVKNSGAQPTASAQPSSPGATSLGPVRVATVSAEPGAALSENTKACVAGDTSPNGTVSGGYRKVVKQTPFGSACQWEAIR